jgi:hypothetical protein
MRTLEASTVSEAVRFLADIVRNNLSLSRAIFQRYWPSEGEDAVPDGGSAGWEILGDRKAAIELVVPSTSF